MPELEDHSFFIDMRDPAWCTPYNLQPPPYTTPYTLHPTPSTTHHTPCVVHTLHPTPHTTPSTLHHTPYTLRGTHPTPYTTHYTLHHTLYTLHPTPCDRRRCPSWRTTPCSSTCAIPHGALQPKPCLLQPVLRYVTPHGFNPSTPHRAESQPHTLTCTRRSKL
jgi:hypothetical protein